MHFLLVLLLAAPPAPALPTDELPAATDAPQQQQSQAQPKDPDKTSDEKKPETPPHTGIRALLDGLRLDIAHLPSMTNLYFAAGGGGLALAVHPFDQDFNVHLRSHYDVVNNIYAPAKYYGDTPEQVALSLGTYAWGRIFDQPKMSHLGMDLLRAQAISELLVEPLKYSTQRLRPDGSNHLSFPSGHSAVTFAGATVLERHLGWKKAALAYAIAAYVASSRMHDNVHYLSDVVFGAALGTIAGRTVTEHGRETWSFTPAPVPGGAAILITKVGE
ncbi:MAG TPA: phosphatase PAP2 family protein [Vicinamibacterales bacterium]|nr:phosphatase PAP2 family protein [Vicinamibacterales bacterium]